MGYCTDYELTRVEQPPTSSFLNTLIDAIECNPFEGSSKWYEHEGDIARAMCTSGADLVEIHGEGEEQGDVWDKVFTRNGNDITIAVYTYALVRPNGPTALITRKE